MVRRYEARFKSLRMRDRRAIAKRYKGFYTRQAEQLGCSLTAVRNAFLEVGPGSDRIHKHLDETLTQLGELPSEDSLREAS